MKKKTIKISSKRQITIPKELFTQLGFDTKAECVLCEDELVIRPVRTDSNCTLSKKILVECCEDETK